MILAQSTAYTRMFKMIDNSDHFSKKTGLTCTVNLSKAGGSFGAAGGTVTEVASGWYKVALSTTDTNTLGDLAYYITASGADDTDFADTVSARILDNLAYPATSGRSMVVDANGLVDATAVKVGPTGSGTAQTARDIGGALPAAAPQAAGGLITSTAGSLDLDEMNVDIEAIQAQTDKLAFTVANQVDANVLDWKSATAPAMTGDAFARLGAPAGASVSADVAAIKAETAEIDAVADQITFTVANQVDVNVKDVNGTAQTAGDLAALLNEIEGETDAIGTPSGTSLAADIAAVKSDTGGIASLPTNASIKTQVVAALNSDTYAEPGQGAPASTTSLAAKIGYLYKFAINKITQTATTESVYDATGATVDQKATVSDDGTTTTRGAIGSGP